MRVIDLFAGAGGMSTGAVMAGATVVAAANHWQLAVDIHKANHPRTKHHLQDLRQMDFSTLPDVDGILAAPACQGHSTASQGKRRAYHDELRSTAWAVIDAVEAKQPPFILVENVPAFLRWQLFPVWKFALDTLGYRVSVQTLTASRFGVPQRRERLFILGVKGRRGPALELHDPKAAEPAFGPCIDWRSGTWKPIAGKSAAVKSRIRAGRKRFGDRFITQHVTGHRGRSIEDPLMTVTTKDQIAVVRGRMMRPLTIKENLRAMSLPDDYKFPKGIRRTDALRAIGNAVCPLQAEGILRQIQERI